MTVTPLPVNVNFMICIVTAVCKVDTTPDMRRCSTIWHQNRGDTCTPPSSFWTWRPPDPLNVPGICSIHLMLDLAALHIMELAFSKHVDNKLDSPSSGCTFAIAMNTVWGRPRFKYPAYSSQGGLQCCFKFRQNKSIKKQHIKSTKRRRTQASKIR